ncbi:hypothetical protein [Streptomyces sp. NPDC021608]|uniref:hypothetical protein n=1 Tax=Streptomyces sp. NPDC021608 TaxID=3154903 RepID=UPI0033FB7515
MSSPSASPLISGGSTAVAAVSGAPSWLVIVLAALTLLPLIIKEWRSWRMDHHERSKDRWTEERRRRNENERRELHQRIEEEIGQLPDGPNRVELYLTLFDRAQIQVSTDDPPQPGEGAANSP